MSFDFIQINNFRNLQNAELKFHEKINLIVGANASGKTSILEALYFMSHAKSFRTSHTHHLIKEGADNLTVFAHINDSNGNIEKVGLERSKHKTLIKASGETEKNIVRISKLLPIQHINPDIQKLIEEGPRVRRKFLDWGVFHVEHPYGETWNRFMKVLKQRNAALKNKWPQNSIKHWDEQFIDLGEQLTKSRIQYVEELISRLDHLSDYHEDFSKLSIQLNRGWDSKKSLQVVLDNHQESDRRFGFSQFGPHKADLVFQIAKSPAREKLSRGQIKILAVLLKLTQIKLLGEKTQQTTVTLVDDLESELDESFKNYLIEELIESKSQVVITSTNPRIEELFKEKKFEYSMFHVEHGLIKVVL